MSIECICINDSNRPKEIPQSKWVKEGEKYTVIYTVTVLPQKQLGFHLAEIELTDNELPYEYFLASRFGFTQDNLQKLIELIKDCSEIDFSMDELLEQTHESVV
jgi:hypothetical protein